MLQHLSHQVAGNSGTHGSLYRFGMNIGIGGKAAAHVAQHGVARQAHELTRGVAVSGFC